MEVKVVNGKLQGHYMPKAYEIWYRRHWWSDWEFVKDKNGNPRVVLTESLATSISTEIYIDTMIEENQKGKLKILWDCIKTILYRRPLRVVKKYAKRMIGIYA